MNEDNGTININGDAGSYDLDLVENKIIKRKELRMVGSNLVKTTKSLIYQGLSGLTIVDTHGASTFIKSEDRLTSIAYENTSNTILLGGLRGLYHFHGQENISAKDKILTCRTEDIGFNSKQMAFAATRAYGLIVITKGKRIR
ncbi:MAG: hypothetical protein IPJ60_07580 [Sphingobacteriaceae bacterium]|nr:hypothetical protein [Sphingobacteriaceae bacterium]